MSKSKLFQTKDASERRTLTHKVRVSPREDEVIRQNAAVRNLDIAEFHRRTALAKRADVSYHQEIVLTLSGIVRVVKEYRAALVERGLPAPDELLLELILEAIAAMKRIEPR